MDSMALQLKQLCCGGAASRFILSQELFFWLQSATARLRELQCKALSYCWYGKSTDFVQVKEFKRRQE